MDRLVQCHLDKSAVFGLVLIVR